MRPVDINADVGEGCGFDALLMTAITSANVAAGYHAGSLDILRDTIRLATTHGVAVGAHPGFRDPANFGRREIPIGLIEAQSLVGDQLALVAAAAGAEGARVQHVKPHGALYNMAARDRALADAVARAISAFDPRLILFAPSHSHLFAAGRAAGLRVAGEVFADRAYAADGSLVPRTQPGAVLDDVDQAIARAVRMATDGTVIAIDGSVLRLTADTICVHGDTPGSVDLAITLRTALEQSGLDVRSVAAC